MAVISVIIPTYNRSQYLNRTLSALATQKTALDYEVLVLDDYGKDRKASDLAQFWSRNMPLRFLKPEDYGMKNGRTRIRNLGINQAKGDILVFLDDDMIVTPNFIEEHYKSHIDADKNIVLGYRYYVKLAFQFLEYVNPVNIVGDPLVLEHLPTVRDERESIYQFCRGDLNTLVAPWVLLYSNNCSVRKHFLVSAGGGFNSTFAGAWGGEDVELGYRLFHAGGKYVLNRKAIGYHQWHYVDWRKNINSLRTNLRRLFLIHPGLDTELYQDYVETGLDNFLKDLQRFQTLNGGYPRSILDQRRARNEFAGYLRSNKNGRTMLVGAGNGSILSHVKPDVCVDVRKYASAKWSENNGRTRWHHLLGTHVPYPDRYFDYVIVNDFLTALRPYHRKLLFKEALRLANKKVIFVTSTDKLKTLGRQMSDASPNESLANTGKRVFGLEPYIGNLSVNTETNGEMVILCAETRDQPSFKPQCRLIIIADAGMADGFCDNAVELVLALSKKGCKVSLQLENYSNGGLVRTKELPSWNRYSKFERDILGRALDVDVKGEQELYPQLSLTSKSHYFNQRIEWLRSKTIGIMSSPYVHALNNQFDTVWCPGQTALECFVNSGGIAAKAHVIFVGVSKGIASMIRPPTGQKPGQKFRFVCIGTIEKSDGIDIAIEAFCKGFKKITNAELIVQILPLKVRAGIHQLRHHNRTARVEHSKHVEQALALYRYRIERWRRLVRYEGLASHRVRFQTVNEQLRMWPELFDEARCYVQSHRVDPIGQRVVQAMSAGIPVITTARYLPDHLTLPGMNYLIKSHEITAADGEWSSQVVYSRWAEPDKDELVNTMRHVYFNQHASRQRGKVGKDFVCENASWERVSDDVIKSLSGLPGLPEQQKNRQDPTSLEALFAGLQEKGLINIEEEAYERK